MPKDTISLKGHAFIEDVINALDPMLSEETLATLNKELERHLPERIMLDDCEVFVEEAIDTLDDAGKLPEPETLDFMMDQGDVQGLAEAIRCGDREQAELLLDKVFADCGASSQVKEWIERGRYSKRAREAMRPKPDAVRIAA